MKRYSNLQRGDFAVLVWICIVLTALLMLVGTLLAAPIELPRAAEPKEEKAEREVPPKLKIAIQAGSGEQGIRVGYDIWDFLFKRKKVEIPLALLFAGQNEDVVSDATVEIEQPSFYEKNRLWLNTGALAAIAAAGYYIAQQEDDGARKPDQFITTTSGPIFVIDQSSGRDNDSSLDIRPRNSDLPK